MTLPAYKAQGSTSETSVPWPAGHAVGDFGLLIVVNPDTSFSTPSGYTLVEGCPVLVASVRLYVFYKIATSTSEANVSIVASADHNFGVILTYTGVNTLNPFHLIATAINPSNTSHYWPGSETYLDDSLILDIAGWQVDSAGPLSSTETNADLASLTERFDGGTTTGNGSGIVVIEGAKASKGPFAHTESTFGSASITVNLMLALQATDKTAGTKSRIVNTGM